MIDQEFMTRDRKFNTSVSITMINYNSDKNNYYQYGKKMKIYLINWCQRKFVIERLDSINSTLKSDQITESGCSIIGN